MDKNLPEIVKPVDIQDYAMSPRKVVEQVQLIQQVMKEVMKQDEHYGTIPGTQKPTLYKPGAEKLSFTFRFSPSYRITKTNLENGHREYEVTCILTHIVTDKFIGEGVGSCSTMEGKYRYRDTTVSTGNPVPKEYWKNRDQGLIGGKGFKPWKNPDTNQWEIATVSGKEEYDNPADYYNTVLKMAKKRAHIDAVLTATAASDIFTQDLEDMQPEPEKKPEKEEPRKSPGRPSNETVLDDWIEAHDLTNEKSSVLEWLEQLGGLSKAVGNLKNNPSGAYTHYRGMYPKEGQQSML